MLKELNRAELESLLDSLAEIGNGEVFIVGRKKTR